MKKKAPVEMGKILTDHEHRVLACVPNIMMGDTKALQLLNRTFGFLGIGNREDAEDRFLVIVELLERLVLEFAGDRSQFDRKILHKMPFRVHGLPMERIFSPSIV